MRYQVTAYDKDSDDYDVLFETPDMDVATSVAEAFAKFVKADRLLNIERQPYDWTEIYTVDDDGYCELYKQFGV